MFTFGMKNLVIMVIILAVGCVTFFLLPASALDLKLNKKQEEKLEEKKEE